MTSPRALPNPPSPLPLRDVFQNRIDAIEPRHLRMTPPPPPQQQQPSSSGGRRRAYFGGLFGGGNRGGDFALLSPGGCGPPPPRPSSPTTRVYSSYTSRSCAKLTIRIVFCCDVCETRLYVLRSKSARHLRHLWSTSNCTRARGSASGCFASPRVPSYLCITTRT